MALLKYYQSDELWTRRCFMLMAVADDDMSDSEREKFRERVVRTVAANTAGSGPDAIDADHIRVHLCANSGYPVEQVNRAIADCLEAGELIETEDGYVTGEGVSR
jgi:hypothetical protein